MTMPERCRHSAIRPAAKKRKNCMRRALRRALPPRSRFRLHGVLGHLGQRRYAPGAMAAGAAVIVGVQWSSCGSEDDDDATLIDEAIRRGGVNNSVRMHALKLMFQNPGDFSKPIMMSALLGFLVAVGPLVGLKLLGFTAAGVAKGSVAALIQSTFPNVAAGSWFAWGQSTAALKVFGWAGMGLTTTFASTVGIKVAELTAFGDKELLNNILKRGLMDSKMRELLKEGKS